jgi:hypothetical protein
MTMVALYYMATISPRWPYISWSTGGKIVAALALALNVRAGALVYLGYVGLLVAVFVVAERNWHWRRLADTAARLALLVVATLLLGTVFWPWAQSAPLTRPIQAFLGMANYSWNGNVLFNGHNYPAQSLPWYYIPWWFLISTPPVVLLGAALSAWFAPSREHALRRLALWFVAVFPVAAAIARHSTVYDGIRHFDFVYPILVVLAASGWIAVLNVSRQAWLRRSAAAALAIGLVTIVSFDVRFHPNQGVYFNSLVGGPRGAFGRYDMDYWGNSVLQALEWCRDVARSTGAVVTVSGSPQHLVQRNSERFPELFVLRPPRGQAYLVIRLARGSVEGVMELAQQPSLHEIRTPDGALLCSVLPGPAYQELQDLKARAVSRPARKEDGR